MTTFFNFLFSYQFQKLLDIDSEVDSRISPKALLKQLENLKNKAKFITFINKPTQNPYRIIRKLHLCNLLILNSQNNYQLVLNEIKISVSKDKFLNKQFIQPYHMFLRKCCSCPDLYSQTKKVSFHDNNYQLLFFIINLFSILFKTINKISLLGKFYKKQNTPVMQGVIEMIAFQSKQLYFVFKSLLTVILSNPKQYIKTKEQQIMIKGILIQDLATINERMKQVLLYKEFYPYGKSIGIKLFRIQETPADLQCTVKGIMTDHIETNRRRDRQEMEDQLFNGESGFNFQFFQQTLLSGGRDNILRGLRNNNRENRLQRQSEVVLSQQSQSDSDQQNDFVSEQQNRHQFSEIQHRIQRNGSDAWEQDSEQIRESIDAETFNNCKSNATKDSISQARTPLSFSGNLETFPQAHQPVFIKTPLSKTQNGKVDQERINDLMLQIQKKKGDTQ